MGEPRVAQLMLEGSPSYKGKFGEWGRTKVHKAYDTALHLQGQITCTFRSMVIKPMTRYASFI